MQAIAAQQEIALVRSERDKYRRWWLESAQEARGRVASSEGESGSEEDPKEHTAKALEAQRAMASGQRFPSDSMC